MKQVLNRYKHIKTGEIKDIWETEYTYTHHSFKFENEFIQIPYNSEEIGVLK